MGNTATSELIGTGAAAKLVGVCDTHFLRLANESPAVIPRSVTGLTVKVWSGEQVAEIKSRRKRVKK